MSTVSQDSPSVFADPLVTAGQAAAYLSVAESSLEKWRMHGRGPKYVKLGRAVRYRISDLNAWVSESTVASTAEVQARRQA